jgi:ABC-type branched-subunit amino acid transport system substrate-binding protein
MRPRGQAVMTTAHAPARVVGRPLQALVGATLLLTIGPACEKSAPEDPISIGLLLSYTGFLAANSINSERALAMAIQAANSAGGAQGRPLRLVARDTRSEGVKVAIAARELVAAGVVAFIGPDTTDLVGQLRSLLQDRTIILPSFATASNVPERPASWFVMGLGASQVACELMAELRADGRQRPLVISNPSGYNGWIAYYLGINYSLPKEVVSTADIVTPTVLQRIVGQAADAYVLAAFPPSATSLLFSFAAIGAFDDPSRWYLSPTLHVPTFLDAMPRGALRGAHGVSVVTSAVAADFRASFAERWHDVPLDDAYAFYDAGAVIALAIARAVIREGAVPPGTGLSKHILAVTHAGGVPIQWDQLARGLELLGQDQEVAYQGLTGSLEFDPSGQPPAPSSKWWTVGDKDFTDLSTVGDCRH